MSNYEEEFTGIGDRNESTISKSFLNYLKSKEDLEKAVVKIDVRKLLNSNIKQIVIPLHRFIEWKCFDAKKQKLHKTQMFEACLDTKDTQKAKKLNRIYATELWGLFDESVKEKMNFEDFVD